MDELTNIHPCYKTCFCEGRTTKSIETFNILTSFIFLILALKINNDKPFKHKHLLVYSLIILFFGSTIFHYHYYNYAAFLDIMGIILVLISFIIIKKHLSLNIYLISILFIILFSIMYFEELFNTLTPVPLIIACFIIFLYYLFFYNISIFQFILAILTTIFWLIDRFSNICIHWLFHLSSAYLFYNLYKTL